jgi:hypothetical protein
VRQGLEEKCARLVEIEPDPAARPALIREACDKRPEDCALHPIEWALRAAKLPIEARDAGR